MKKIKNTTRTLPRHQRDIAHLYSIVKAVTLLNAPLRMNEKGQVVANDKDIEEAMKLWSVISVDQELGLSPATGNFYRNCILAPYNKYINKDSAFVGLSRSEIGKIYYEVYGATISGDTLRKVFIPALEDAGMIEQIRNFRDKKQKIIIPLVGVQKAKMVMTEDMERILKIMSE